MSGRFTTAAPVHVMALILLWLGAAVPLRASVVVPLSLTQLIQVADVVADGQVVGVHITTDRGRVERVVTVRVADTWKGHAAPLVHVRLAGGVVGRTRVVVPGVPDVGEGERFLWFLSGQPDGTFAVVGLHQGAWRVTRSPIDGQAMAGPALASTHRGVVRRGDGTRAPRPLASIRGDVERVLGGVR